jgi:hypothetical protein
MRPANAIGRVTSTGSGQARTFFEYDAQGRVAAGSGAEGSCPAGYVQNNSDCLDTSANVRPGQTACFTSPRPDGTFDDDCSGAQTPCNLFTYVSQCQGVYCANPSCPSTTSTVTGSNCGSFLPTSCRPNNPFCFQSCSSNDYQTVSCR